MNNNYQSAIKRAKEIIAKRGEPEVVLWDDGISVTFYYGSYDEELVSTFWNESSESIQIDVESFCEDLGLLCPVNYSGIFYDSIGEYFDE
jgi:hypothetical protein